MVERTATQKKEAENKGMDFTALKDKIVWAAISGMIVWQTFLTVQMMEMPKRFQTEIREILKTSAPWYQDKTLVLERQRELLSAVKGNAEEIYQIKIQLGKILVIPPADFYQRMESIERKIDRLK